MLSWVVKVVPQPPEPPPKRVEDRKEEKPAAAPSAPPALVSHTIFNLNVFTERHFHSLLLTLCVSVIALVFCLITSGLHLKVV